MPVRYVEIMQSSTYKHLATVTLVIVTTGTCHQ